MSIAQLILYDQLNYNYLDQSCDSYIFLLSRKSGKGPYGKIDLNPHSQVLEYALSRSYISGLTDSGKDAVWQVCDTYYSGILDFCNSKKITELRIMIPSENYIYEYFMSLVLKLASQNILLIFISNTQFLISHEDFKNIYPDKVPVMENFYRMMRKRFDILMDGDKPIGGKRNYDSENRKFDKNHNKVLDHKKFDHIYLTEAQNYYGQEVGSIDYPIDREQALELLDFFIYNYIDNFGRLEDAMYISDGMVYHSMISTSINFGLLMSFEVIAKIASADTDINNKEGYIRQILGWREYMYHFFHFYKSDIYTQNHHNYHTKLPYRFWKPEDSPLDMNCINIVLNQVKETGYSHHITRLMIIGNFAQLAGINPHDVNKRFWEMYVDAFERVVTPNVLAMSQFSDGGRLATKPYVSSANYINNMSDYCGKCKYDPKEKYGPKTCPFNYLYRSFVNKNKETFIKGRQPFIVNNIPKIDMNAIEEQKEEFINKYIK